MADYVSILKRTLDGLGSGATPALRERVYGRAREAVRRQLDGMQPPPAEDVKERQLAQLEAAVIEIEAGYADPDASAVAPAPDAAPDSAPTSPASASPATSSPAPVPSPPVPSPPVAPPAPRDNVATGETVPGEPPAGMAPDADRGDAAEDGAPIGTTSVAGVASAEPDALSAPGADDPIMPPVDDLPPSMPSTAASPVRDVPPPSRGDAPAPLPPVPPTTASPAPTPDAVPSDIAPSGTASPGTVAPAPSVERNAAEPEMLDADGPVGGYLPGEDLPPVAMIGPHGDPVLDPSEAVPLGRTGGASAILDAPALDATPPDAGTFGVETGADDATPATPPASTLASAAIPRTEPLTPEPLEPETLEPSIPGTGAIGAAGAGISALAFANRGRPDLPGSAPDVASPVIASPTAVPLAGEPVEDAPAGAAAPSSTSPTDASVAMPRTDGPADPFGAPPPPAAEPVAASEPAAAEPIAVKPVPGEAPAAATTRADGPPDITVPPDARRRGRGGLWAGLLALLVIVGGLLLAREPLAEATGVEGFRTAFGLGPVVDDAIENVRVLVADDGTDGGADDVPVEVADPVDPPEPADPPVATGDTTVADVPIKTPDRLPGTDGSGTDGPDISPSDDDVTVQVVPIEPVTPDDAAPGEEVAGLTPDDPTATPTTPTTDPTTTVPITPAVPQGDARAFLVGEPVAGTSERVDGAVSWSVGSESPGRDLPPEPAVRGDVALSDGTRVEVTVRRNADESLPASHLIEIVFALPDGTRTIGRLPLVGFKDALGVPARPLVAVPAKITDDFFVVGLNSLASAVQSNLALMGSEQFMDIQIIDGNDRRATLTLEKGEAGTTVFGEVLDAWNDAPLPG